MADLYEIGSSMAEQGHEFAFKNKINVRIPDTNNSSYPSSQINFNLSSLTTYNYFLSCKQSTIEIPYVVGVAVSGSIITTTSAHMVALKKSVADLVNGISVQLNENSIIKFSDLSNLHYQFKVLSTWSQDDVNVIGDVINFAKNPTGSYDYQATASVNGIGECNNILIDAPFVAVNTYVQGVANKGLVKRMKQTSYNPANTTLALYTNASKSDTRQKSYWLQSSTTQSYYYMMVTIPLTELHDLFGKLPLIRNPYFKITLQMHTSTTVIPFTDTANVMGLTSVSSSYN